MELIDNYLDTMFSRYPRTPQIDEARGELRTMMEDAYDSSIASGMTPNEALGRVITDFGNLDELAPTLGLADSAEVQPVRPVGRSPLTITQAIAYAEAYHRSVTMLTWAVVLFVLAPIPLLSLSILASETQFILTESIAGLIGFVFLLPIIGVGVVLLLRRGYMLAPFGNIREGNFTATVEVTGWAEALRAEHGGARTTGLATAVTLWILSALPLLASGFLGEMVGSWGEALPAIGLPLTLILVAAGLAVFLPRNWAFAVADHVSSPESSRDYTSDESQNPLVRAIMAAYWPVMVAIYLAWSFLGDAWSTSWVLWPVAGVAFAAFAAFVGAWSGSNSD